MATMTAKLPVNWLYAIYRQFFNVNDGNKRKKCSCRGVEAVGGA